MQQTGSTTQTNADLLAQAVAAVRLSNPALASKLECLGSDLSDEEGLRVDRIMSNYQAACRRSAHAAEAMEAQAEEYEAEVARLSELSAAAGLHPDSLPAGVRDHLAALAGIANELDLAASVSDNALCAAWGSLCVEDMRAARLSMMLSLKGGELDRLEKKVQAGKAELEASMAAARTRLARADRQLPIDTNLQEKLVKYRDQAGKHQRELDASGARPELKHSALVAQHADLEALQALLASKRESTAAFHGLPPSVEHARLQLQQLQEMIGGMQQRLYARLGLQG
ncbi:hypothetical protein FOA52_011857 [Chlamydomonas sp. UWO 241]|nr:hypothetical protein FOA52_011857 [Chlamydomonas sp. UWO 241]